MATMEFSSRRGVVTVTEETVTRGDGTVVVNRYIVASPTGYRASLPACYADDCLEGRRKVCAIPTGDRGEHSVKGGSGVRAWLNHSREYCHGWHALTVERYARDVLKSFEPWKPRPRTLPGFESWWRTSRRPILLGCPAWPVVDDLPKVLPELCSCPSCKSTLALIGAL